MDFAVPVYAPLLSKYPNSENEFAPTVPETNTTFPTADPEKVKVPLSVPDNVACTVKDELLPSVSVADTWSEPVGKLSVPLKVPARFGTWVAVNVPESEQLELLPE